MARCLFQKGKQIKSVQIHGFSDASQGAYAAVVYLRVEYETEEIETKFIASMAKVYPIKQQSIPRLELLAAFLLSKLVHSVHAVLQEELEDKSVETFYWVDSYSALCWIKKTSAGSLMLETGFLEF